MCGCVYALYVWICVMHCLCRHLCMHCVCGCVCMHCMWMCVCVHIVCVDVDTDLDNLGHQALVTVPNLSTVEEEAAVTVQYKAQCLNLASLPKVLKFPFPSPSELQSLPSSLHHKPNSSEPCPKFNNQKRQNSEERTNSLLLRLILFPRPA